MCLTCVCVCVCVCGGGPILNGLLFTKGTHITLQHTHVKEWMDHHTHITHTSPLMHTHSQTHHTHLHAKKQVLSVPLSIWRHTSGTRCTVNNIKLSRLKSTSSALLLAACPGVLPSSGPDVPTSSVYTHTQTHAQYTHTYTHTLKTPVIWQASPYR